MKFAPAMAAAAMIGLPALSAAQQITAQNPDSLLSLFQAEGFPAQMKLDGAGDPLITVRYYGTSFSLYFYGCQQGKECTAVQFHSGYRTDHDYTIEQANAWNMEKRYVRSYVTDRGSVRIEYDIFLGQDGVSEDLFNAALNIWLKSLIDFEEYIDW